MSKKKDPVEILIIGMFKAVGTLIKGCFYGIKELRTMASVIGLLVSFMIGVCTMYFKVSLFSLDIPVYIHYLIYIFLLGSPLVYLFCIGQVRNIKQERYNQIFKEIGFMGKDKKYPYLIAVQVEGKKTIYTFKSNISLSMWRRSIDILETGMDCSIRLIREGKNKKTVSLVTVSSDYRIPPKLDWNDSFLNKQDGVLCIGESDLNIVSFDLNRTPHVLAAGETGSGKSVVLRCMLWQMINKGCRIFMIDFKGGVEFGKRYEKFGEVITERERALEVLQMLVNENSQRLKLFRDMEVKNLKEYNDKTGSDLCRIGVFIDEIGEMLDKKGASKEDKPVFEKLEGFISTLARLSRATGINLIFGVQRPDANVLTGQIKNNLPVRISGRFSDRTASEIVLGNSDACDIPDIKGRFIYKVGNETIVFQAFYFDDETMLNDVQISRGSMLTEENRVVTENIKPIKTTTNSAKSGTVDLDLNF